MIVKQTKVEEWLKSIEKILQATEAAYIKVHGSFIGKASNITQKSKKKYQDKGLQKKGSSKELEFHFGDKEDPLKDFKLEECEIIRWEF